MVMLRNPYYKPQPSISDIDINFVDSVSLTTTYLLGDTADLAPIEPTNAPSIAKQSNLQILDNKAYDITTLEYNDTVYPYNMTSFRQAMSLWNQSIPDSCPSIQRLCTDCV